RRKIERARGQPGLLFFQVPLTMSKTADFSAARNRVVPIAPPQLDHLRALEAESLHIIREVVAEFERPVMLYSIGKDSSVLLRLAQKAFHPGPIPFPLLHVDTTYKFREMIEFRNWYAKEIGAKLIIHTNEQAIADGTQPFLVGTQRCCGLLKTKSLLDALEA